MALTREIVGYEEATTPRTELPEAGLGFERGCDTVACVMPADNVLFWHKCVLCSPSPQALGSAAGGCQL